MPKHGGKGGKKKTIATITTFTGANTNRLSCLTKNIFPSPLSWKKVSEVSCYSGDDVIHHRSTRLATRDFTIARRDGRAFTLPCRRPRGGGGGGGEVFKKHSRSLPLCPVLTGSSLVRSPPSFVHLRVLAHRATGVEGTVGGGGEIHRCNFSTCVHETLIFPLAAFPISIRMKSNQQKHFLSIQ